MGMVCAGNCEKMCAEVGEAGVGRAGQAWAGVCGQRCLQGAVPRVVAHTSGLMWFWFAFAEKADGTAVDIFSFGMCALEVQSRTAAGPGNPQ